MRIACDDQNGPLSFADILRTGPGRAAASNDSVWRLQALKFTGQAVNVPEIHPRSCCGVFETPARYIPAIPREDRSRKLFFSWTLGLLRPSAPLFGQH